ncbi:PspA/IM30 family protein [Paenibacillus sp. PDC88]|uniref:PspA/IM30 family protein n=1 Tax=Paenibacillus sp. PDC88 TaxID=1884375 RepID=UPI00089D12C1|nr:PspA/IM30 family protein [Paenibacillus sp. PDC88]SDX48828.1 phage shock protein A (PspA) family protein [Paenibacillus sp. PDC88]
MGVFRRMRDITAATINEHLEQSQDPVKLIDQFLMDTRNEIGEVEKLHQQYSRHTRQLKQQVDEASAMIAKREEQALLALKAEEDHLAKLALQEKMLYEEKYKQYIELYDQSRDALTELEEQLDHLKTEYQAVYSKRQYYYARMQTIQLQQRMNERSGQYGGRHVPGMFNRLEDRVSDLEYEARSLRDLRRGEQSRETTQYSVSDLLEREMAKLKKKLENGGKE